jgi:hypothetical protein
MECWHFDLRCTFRASNRQILYNVNPGIALFQAQGIYTGTEPGASVATIANLKNICVTNGGTCIELAKRETSEFGCLFFAGVKEENK